MKPMEEDLKRLRYCCKSKVLKTRKRVYMNGKGEVEANKKKPREFVNKRRLNRWLSGTTTELENSDPTISR